ncbi:ABC transporter ATP-binding protein [Paenibacillus sp. P26]|nr:ABC transporter ATP-binding protein [Paenibacillus sp. P26]UUZ95607.1 ABC transporter ATP-binding protein [Paenibacillus sp. P25]
MPQPFGIRFESVCKKFGAVTVIPSLDLEIASGERLVLLGPSGCGKTTIMRMIAGLEQPATGKIYMGGRMVNDIDARERNVAMVFQNYALYPHMTVFENMAFSLKMRKLSKAEIGKRILAAADKLGLGALLERKPRELSGGQRQRVALGRAIVQQSPYFLLDEPLSNLDAQLRTGARNELVDLHETYPSTMVYVTHDQVEAMTIGQRIAVLNKGQVQQIGTPGEIYNHPANRFVATFIGNPQMNMLPVHIGDNGMVLAGQSLILPPGMMSELRQNIEHEAWLGIRPEGAVLQGPDDVGFNGGAGITIEGEYLRSEYLGAVFVHHVAVQQHRLQIAMPRPVSIPPHSAASVFVPFEQLHWFEQGESERRIPLSGQYSIITPSPGPVLVS